MWTEEIPGAGGTPARSSGGESRPSDSSPEPVPTAETGSPTPTSSPSPALEAEPSSRSTSSADGSGTTSSRRAPIFPSSSSRTTGNDEVKIWSPSQTDDYSRCPRMWDLSRRWERFGGMAWTPERLIGESIHVGVATHYRALRNGPGDTDPHPPAAEAAVRYLGENWPADAPAQFTYEGAESLVLKALDKALTLQDDVLRDGGAVVGVEFNFGEAVADLITRHGSPGHQYLAVTDWKYNHSVPPDYIKSRLDEAERTWGLWHYAWRAQGYFGLPVRFIRKGLIVGTPRTVARLAEVEVTPEALERWETDAYNLWREMSLYRRAGVLPPARWSACKLYGGCAFYDGCHRLAADETRFSTLYMPKDWSNWKPKHR